MKYHKIYTFKNYNTIVLKKRLVSFLFFLKHKLAVRFSNACLAAFSFYKKDTASAMSLDNFKTFISFDFVQDDQDILRSPFRQFLSLAH